mgnify:CR=1 FL=1
MGFLRFRFYIKKLIIIDVIKPQVCAACGYFYLNYLNYIFLYSLMPQVIACGFFSEKVR